MLLRIALRNSEADDQSVLDHLEAVSGGFDEKLKMYYSGEALGRL